MSKQVHVQQQARPANGVTPPAATPPPAAVVNPPAPETPPAATPPTPPVDPVAAAIDAEARAMAAKVGVNVDSSDFALVRQLAKSQIGDWLTVREKLLAALGEYRGFATLTIRSDGASVTVDRNNGAKSSGGGTGGKAPVTVDLDRAHCHATDKTACACDDSGTALPLQYGLTVAHFPSIAGLAHALADAKRETRPPYGDAINRYIRNNAKDIAAHMGDILQK